LPFPMAVSSQAMTSDACIGWRSWIDGGGPHA
jgi:hypothetical protein